MPPKPKLHKHKGKDNSLVLNSGNNPPSNSTPNPLENADVQEQFETELCWCIQQLQRALSSNKLNPKQVQENTKVLNTLMNNSTPFIKKRQLMRLTFGDYRAKMIEENRKISKGMNIKISPASPSKKSKFVKKSVFASGSDSSFKFNFNIENNEDVILDTMSKVEINDSTSSQPFLFTSSANEFRFNFDVNES